MNQYLKISIEVDSPKEQLMEIVQSYAQSLGLEGTIQCSYEPMILKIYVCGMQSAIEEFIDKIHHTLADCTLRNIIMEPFVRQKDYRGVFRIIE